MPGGAFSFECGSSQIQPVFIKEKAGSRGALIWLCNEYSWYEQRYGTVPFDFHSYKKFFLADRSFADNEPKFTLSILST